MKITSTPSSCGQGQPAGSGISAWLHGRRLLIVAAVGVGSAGLWLGWPTLVVLGVAPVLVALAPCLLMCGAMCAIGACKKKQPVTAATTETPGPVPIMSSTEPETVATRTTPGG